MFEALNAIVVGASFDEPSANKEFALANDFPFRLLSDETKEVADAYGVSFPVEHEYREYSKRLSFLIDPQGRINRVYVVRDVNAHPDEVLADLERTKVS